VSAPSSPYGVMCGPYYPCLEGQYCGEADHTVHLFSDQVDPFGTLWETMVTILQVSTETQTEPHPVDKSISRVVITVMYSFYPISN
jgi:hypothetical protein